MLHNSVWTWPSYFIANAVSSVEIAMSLPITPLSSGHEETIKNHNCILAIRKMKFLKEACKDWETAIAQ